MENLDDKTHNVNTPISEEELSDLVSANDEPKGRIPVRPLLDIPPSSVDEMNGDYQLDDEEDGADEDEPHASGIDVDESHEEMARAAVGFIDSVMAYTLKKIGQVEEPKLNHGEKKAIERPLAKVIAKRMDAVSPEQQLLLAIFAVYSGRLIEAVDNRVSGRAKIKTQKERDNIEAEIEYKLGQALKAFPHIKKEQLKAAVDKGLIVNHDTRPAGHLYKHSELRNLSDMWNDDLAEELSQHYHNSLSKK